MSRTTTEMNLVDINNHTTSDYEAYNRQLERLNAILEIERKVNNNI